ncbi:MAG: DUF3795 domain-containing protein [Planctomycetota bacterium]
METTRRREAFEHIRYQIGFCGIWCGSCALGNGCLAELAGGLRELLTAYAAPEWASVEVGWEGFLKGLGSVREAASCAGCRKGGGRDNCEIRACALGRGVEHCTDCMSFGRCEHATILDHMRSGAARAGLSVLSPGENPEAVLPEWTRRVMVRWPCCVLFAEDG